MKRLFSLAGLCMFILPPALYAQPVQPWRQLMPPGARSINCLLAVGSKLYAGTEAAGVFVSDNQGQTWRAINIGLTAFTVTRIAGNQQLLLILVDGAGVYRLAPAGESWQPVNAGLLDQRIEDVAVIADIGFVAYYGGVYRLNSGSSAWAKRSVSGFSDAGTLLCSYGSTLYALGNRRLLRSDNLAESWQAFPITDPYYITPVRLAANADVVLIGTGSGLYRAPTSDLNAQERIQITTDLFWGPTEFAISGKTILAPIGKGLIASTDNGLSWRPAGLFNHQIYALTTLASSFIAGSSEGLTFGNDNPLSDASAVTAASYRTRQAPNSISAIFGARLATTTEIAATVPLPTNLASTSMTIQDSAGTIFPAGLFFVSPNQINVELPGGLAEGDAIYTITAADGAVRSGFLDIQRVAPAIFTANSDGAGAPAGYMVRNQNGTLTNTNLYRYDNDQKKFVPQIVSMTPNGAGFGLVLFGTGWRNRTSASLTMCSTRLAVAYAGPAPGFVGLDQMNITIPRYSGTCRIMMTVNGVDSNEVIISTSF